MKYFFKKLAQDQGGSALTEFVIVLPIFILIFSGMGSLYQISHINIQTAAVANHALWVESQKTPPIQSMSPLGGGIEGLIDIFGSGSTSASDIADLSQIGGIYTESYAKTIIPSELPIGTGLEPEHDIDEITGLVDGSPAKILLNDRADVSNFDGGGVVGILSGLISTVGAGLAISAGIRYGEVSSSYQPGPVTTIYGTYQTGSVSLSLPRNTSATHRLIPIAMIRLEHMREDVLGSAILEFVNVPDYPDQPEWSQNSTSTSASGDPEMAECINQIQAEQTVYDNCISANAPAPVPPATTPTDAQLEAAADNCDEPDTSCLEP